MKGEKDEIEDSLRGLTPRPVPPGLRTKVLASALEAKRSVAMTPRMWMVISVCAALIIATLLGDAVVSKHHSNALLAIVRGPAASRAVEEKLLPLPAEISALEPALGARALGQNLLLRDLLARRGAGRKSLHESLEVIEQMKGWIDDEVSENFY